MSFYPDANFILRLCVRSDKLEAQADTERALRWLSRKEIPVVVTPLALYETRKQFWQLPEAVRVAAETRLEGLLTDWESAVTGWSEAIESALSIARDFRARLIVDSADTLHVGWAQAEQCTLFGSFDTNSGARALAHARGLKVWPEMTEKDFSNLAKMKS